MGTFKECSKNADIPPDMSLEALVHKVPHFKAQMDLVGKGVVALLHSMPFP